jgi:hypothetical protein
MSRNRKGLQKQSKPPGLDELIFARDQHLQTHMCACMSESCAICGDFAEWITRAEEAMLQPA